MIATNRRTFFIATLLAGTALAAPARAQETQVAAADAADAAEDTIIVTATRRELSLQDVPINIAAVGAAQLASERLDDVRDLGAFTPGITITDTGPRGAGTIVMRGLSADDSSVFADNSNSAIGTYLGEVPLYLDFKLIDLQRVEVLLGPQGTLYGLGTLAGAIRYIPERPDPSGVSGYVHARAYDVAHGSGVGLVGDGAFNIPIVRDVLAFRTATGYYYDPGFIDYPFTVQQAGVSLPQPGPPTAPLGTQAQQDANFTRRKDVNFEKTFTSRNQLGLSIDNLKAYLTYAYQRTKTNGRQANGNGVLGEGRYEGPWRFLEPSDRKAHLVSLEVQAELGDIAQLVSATAYTETKSKSSVDVTDLLLDLDYGYEGFPAFAGFTKQSRRERQFNQELRLVSTHGGPFSWVIGGFYNELKLATSYREYIPGFGASATGSYVIPNADDNEYASFGRSKTKEKAVFGEASFAITPAWQVTGGIRYYDYKLDRFGGSVLPYFDGAVADDFDIPSISGSAAANGIVWKANSSYKFDNLLFYATYSTGYRIGGANTGAAPCVLPLAPPPKQNICALPNELFFGPDKTKNIEVGVRATLFDSRLTANLSVFQVKWDGIQLASLTINGGIGITVNGGAARNRGVDFSLSAKVTDRLAIRGNYSYLDAKLTQDVPLLLQIRDQDGDGSPESIDALKGDRLPGSTKNSGALSATYTIPVADNEVVFNWTATYTGSIVTRPGARAFGEVLPSYVLHRASITYKLDRWEFTAFANNLFDKYAVSGVDNDLSRFGFVNDGIISRYYARSVVQPRVLGIEARAKF